MGNRIAILSASMLSIAILSCAAPAAAVTKTQNFFENPASACQLSMPTIDTVVTPRANGYRNPGTKSAFVICGFPGVNGSPGAGGQAYVSKAVVIPATGIAEIDCLPADLGDVGTISDPAAFSITCSLPPQAGIDAIAEQYDLDVGA